MCSISWKGEDVPFLKFIGRVLNSPIFCQWMTIGFVLFLSVTLIDFATDVNVAIDIANKHEEYSQMLSGNPSFEKIKVLIRFAFFVFIM